MRDRCTLALAVSVLVALAAPGTSPAGGLTIHVPHALGSASTAWANATAGPSLAGDSVAWGAATSSGGFEISAAGADGLPHTVSLLPNQGGSAYVSLTASDRRLAVFETRIACSRTPPASPVDCRDTHTVVDRVLTGPLRGPLAQIGGCSPDSVACGSPSSCGIVPSFGGAVWQDIVALDDPCGGIRVHDYSAPPSTPDTVMPSVPWALIAGRYLAWPEFAPQSYQPLRIVVYDRVAGTEAYHLDTHASLGALQEDGKVAFSTAPPSAQQPFELAWASRTEPFPHLIGSAVPYPHLRMGADRVAVRDGQSARTRTIRVLTLSGQVEATVENQSPIGDFDFDGHRLLWASRRCEDPLILVWRPGDGAPPGPSAAPCPAAVVAQRKLSVATRGPATVHLDCPPTGQLGCNGRVRFLAEARHRGRVRQRDLYLLGSLPYELAAGSGAQLALRLTSSARRFARRHAGAVVRATSIGAPPGGGGLAGSFEVRSAQLVLSR
jgi:hypothetical protein